MPRNRFILGVARDGAYVPSRQKALHLIVSGTQERLDRRRHKHMVYQQREICDPLSRGLRHGQRCGGRSRLEPDGKKYNLAAGCCPRKFQRVKRGINHAHVSPARFGGEQTARMTGYPQHVAKRTENHAGNTGDGNGGIDHLGRRDANRATRTVQQRDARRQKLVNAVTHNRMRLATADFHDGPGLRGDPRDGVDGTLRQSRITKFVHVFHGNASGSSSAKMRSVRLASSASMTAIAKPAWTST